MSERNHLLRIVSPVLVLATATLWAFPVAGAESARLSTFDGAKGQIYYALSLTPTEPAPAPTAHDILVLFDTSATQTGAYRDDALDALKAMLANLGAQDRVKLMALDLNAVPMTADFVPAGSDAMKAALAKLEARVPLGATDMAEGVKGALQSFAGPVTNPRAVVYIGDGMSRGHALQNADFVQLTQQLVERRVPVSSFAIGPGRDVQLLATLANHTGGMVFLDVTEGRVSDKAGAAMAEVARANVYWPTAANLPQTMQETFPKVLPPLRSDRDTVLVGTLQSRAVQDVSVAAEVNGQPVQLRWKVAAEKSCDDFNFLPQLVDTVRPSGGVALPTVGSLGLRQVAAMVAAGADQLAKLGGAALRTGDKEGALKVAEAVLRRDPNNPEALAIRNAAQRMGRGGANDDADLRLVNLQAAPAPADPAAPGGAPPAGGAPAAGGAGGADFLNLVQDAQLLIEKKFRAEVEQGLKDAKQRTATNPDAAERELKLLLETVERQTDLRAEVKQQLKDQVQTQIRQTQREAVEINAKLQLAKENQAAAEERQRLIEETARKRQKIKQLMERFNSLMDEGRYQDAEDIIATQVRELDPLGTTPTTAIWASRFGGHVSEMERLREIRHRNFARALLGVEKALVPFPDEPPIMYPESQVWSDLTLRRKKYASVDLAHKGRAEERIYSALNDDTRFDFIETPLDQAIQFLRDAHEIPIELDKKALDQAGVGTDTPITRTLKGVSLRSGLRMLLKDHDLTYTVKDEVLLITTKEEVDANLVTKVYPVGDLVIPINAGGGVNPFMMGGGMGMMGGGGGMMGGMGGRGGMMGGMMGGGGGMMGGGGGMMGGGMFAVEDDLTLGKKKPTPAVAPNGQAPKEVAKRAEKPAGRVIDLPRNPGESVQDAWNRYFTELKQAREEDRLAAHASVRETVRRLMKREQYEEAAALIQAALRNGFPQTWMYEALGLSLELGGAPKEELERALMSAVDFGSSLDDILRVASYLGHPHLGLEERALKLYRNLSASAPYRPEPYLEGLTIAQRLNDLEGIQWACAGILSQAWPLRERYVEQKADLVYRATIEKLREEKRTKEAEAFERRIAEARVRDCVVMIKWTGDADLDLIVEEPTGTVCSATNPRTTSGGVMLGDAFARIGGETPDGYSEYYVCPQGFTGRYRAIVKNVWGKPTAGKVTVDVVAHYGTRQPLSVQRHVTLKENGTAFAFEVDQGRRLEPLDAQQIAVVMQNQEALGRAILGQQLAGYENSEAAREYARAVAQSPWGNRLRRAVGTMPIITTLPAGTNFNASAVISADRRYVRVTPMPLFSSIGEVSTFSYVTSDNNQGGGIGGGGIGGGGIGGISDGRLKDQVEPLEYGLETVKQLKPVRFKWTELAELQIPHQDGTTERRRIEPRRLLGTQNEVGLIAQEVEKVVPETVASDAEGLKRLNYEKLVPVLIKAVQELAKENEQLRTDVRDLKARLKVDH